MVDPLIGHFDSSRFSALHAVPSPALLSSPLFFFLVLPLRAFPSHQFSLRSPSAFRSTPLSCPAAFFLPTAPDFSTRRPLSFRPFAFPRFHPRSPPFSNREMPGPATDRRLCAPVPSKRRFGQTFPSPPPASPSTGAALPLALFVVLVRHLPRPPRRLCVLFCGFIHATPTHPDRPHAHSLSSRRFLTLAPPPCSLVFAFALRPPATFRLPRALARLRGETAPPPQCGL